jgi:MFS family permease
MLPIQMLRAHWRLLGFGWLMSFGSSFGQTYFISIFGGVIRSDFGLSHSAYGSCYSAGTLASACVLLWAGRLIDRKSLTAFSLGVIGGLALATTVMAGVTGILSLTLAFFALRFFGQGLMTHAAMTAMGRYFSAERGRAVSFAALGHVTGEAVLPLAAVWAMAVLPWRGVWLMSSIFLLACAAPAVTLLLGKSAASTPGDGLRQRSVASYPVPSGPGAPGVAAKRDFALSNVLRDPGLYLRLPVLLAPSFIVTGLIFHQVHIGTAKGWSLTLIASSLSVFAAGSLAMMILAGALVDRFSARRLVPFCLSPLALACLILAASDGTGGALVFFGLLGVGSGLTAVMVGAIWAEIYGITHLGAIRAFGASVMVFSSGLAPVVVGVMFDWGWSVDAIALGCAGYCAAAAAVSAAASSPISRQDPTTTEQALDRL